jgi:hypothetical protein
MINLFNHFTYPLIYSFFILGGFDFKLKLQVQDAKLEFSFG